MVPLLNLDGGEREDEPAALYALADVVHVACGGHAGDEASMDRVIAACARVGTRVGAHPSYEDREGFGRRPRAVTPDALARAVAAQCARLRDAADRAGVALASVKLHGALYHAAQVDPAAAHACVLGATRALGPLPVVGCAGSALERAARELEVAFLREAFADRTARADGSLVPRGEPGALIEEPEVAAALARALAARGDVDTVCVHADTRDALLVAGAVRHALGPKRRPA
jgi:UPF0271 protein